MNRSTPGLPVQHQLPEFTETHFHRVNSSHEVAKVVEFPLYHHSFQRNPRADLLQNGLVGFPCSPRDSQESSPTPQFKSIHSSVLSFLYSSPIYSVYRRKTLMSIKLVHIKRVYELLSSRPRDQTHITSISCTGRQIIY